MQLSEALRVGVLQTSPPSQASLLPLSTFHVTELGAASAEALAISSAYAK